MPTIGRRILSLISPHFTAHQALGHPLAHYYRTRDSETVSDTVLSQLTRVSLDSPGLLETRVHARESSHVSRHTSHYGAFPQPHQHHECRVSCMVNPLTRDKRRSGKNLLVYQARHD